MRLWQASAGEKNQEPSSILRPFQLMRQPSLSRNPAGAVHVSQMNIVPDTVDRLIPVSSCRDTQSIASRAFSTLLMQ